MSRPQLAVLASLEACLAHAWEALRAAHPQIRLSASPYCPPPALPPTENAAVVVTEIIAILRRAIGQYYVDLDAVADAQLQLVSDDDIPF